MRLQKFRKKRNDTIKMARCGDSLVMSVAPQEERKNNDMMLEEKEKIETSSHLCSADFVKANDSN